MPEITEESLKAMTTNQVMDAWIHARREDETIICYELDRRVELGDFAALIY